MQKQMFSCAVWCPKNGALLEEPMYGAYMKFVFEEASRILELEDRQAAWDHVLSVCRRTKSNTSSMLADVLAERKTEADAIIGYPAFFPKTVRAVDPKSAH